MKKVVFVFLISATMLSARVSEAVDCGPLPTWDSGTAYFGGARVAWLGNAYEANWWTLNQDPETYSGLWQEWTLLGPCDGGQPTNQPPTANANGQYAGDVGDSILFTSQGSIDPDGTIVGFQWTFGDGASASTADATHTYSAPGTYTVTLIVTDDDGASSTDGTTATIRTVGSADAGAPSTDAGLPGDGCTPACGPGTVCVGTICQTSITGDARIDGILLGDPTPFNTNVLRAQQPDLSWSPSTLYHWEDFAQGVANMYFDGVGDFRLYLGLSSDPQDRRHLYALVNLAAFLAQAMKETVQYDACDENNWDNTNGYLMSNSCGQLGQDYASYDCDMACPRDRSKIISAVTHAKWYGAPGPLFCAPDAYLRSLGLAGADGSTGRWNYSSDCWPYPATEPGFTPDTSVEVYQRPACEVYAGQRGGGYVWDGSGGSVEGCCWWGRGVIQTTGRCNFGILNHYLGRTHLDPSQFPRPSTVLYGDIDFCADPEVICRSTAHPELKWVAGLFYWMSSVQTYDERGWAYLDQLRAYVDGGMTGTAFIDAVSGIVNRGCHDAPCATGPVDGLSDRRANFDRVLNAMGLR